MMVKTKNGEKEIKIVEGKTILQLFQEHDIFLSAPCGGKGTCGKCKIKVLKGNLPVTEKDEKHLSKDELKKGYRLACSAYPQNELKIAIDLKEENFTIITDFEKKNMHIDSGFEIVEVILGDRINSMHAEVLSKLGKEFKLSLNALKRLSEMVNQKVLYLLTKDERILDVFDKKEIDLYGIAIDIGTTTLAFNLVNLKTGQVKAASSKLNMQRIYGADVISRIEKVAAGKLEKLNEIIKSNIIEGIEELIKDAGIDKRFIYTIVAAGNTTMLHILLGISPKSIGVAPYTSTTLSLLEYDFQTIFESSILDCNVTLLSGISSYIGADIVSGILYYEIFKSDKITMLIDVGTNGEMIIGNKERILGTATAAGPAFEGGNIAYGMGSIPGAIQSIKYNENGFLYEVIGNIEPIGICGSGIIDIISIGIDHGWIDETGLLMEAFSDREVTICHNKEGNPIKLTQKDIREVQLAKSAIRSGMECLIKEFGTNYNNIDKVYLAGGFGSNISIENTINLGMIAKEFRDKVKFVGNTSLGGAVKYMIDQNSKNNLKSIFEISEEIHLSNHLEFNHLFIENMLF